MKIHEIIRENRKKRGLTQEELARYLGVSAPAVNKWEKGQSYPDITLLPVLAAYFNLSVDELLGYEPQMSKADIKKLYHRLAKQFSQEPYETVKAECEEYIKKYHACFPLLLQMAILYLNHLSLAPNEEELMEEIAGLLDCVAEKSDDVHLAKEAVIVKGGCCLMLQKPEEVLDMLGESIHAISQEAEIQAYAYHMKGNAEKAKEVMQVCMYQYLLTLIADAAVCVTWEQEPSEKAEEMMKRTLAVMDIFHVDHLHFNVIAQVYLSFAQYYCMAQNTDSAIEMLERFVECAVTLKGPIHLHGDKYFDKVDHWLADLALGKELPRSEEIVRQSILHTVAENPMFACMKEHQRFRHLVRRLEDFCGKPGQSEK